MWGFWLLIILSVLFIAALPLFPHSRSWGHYPSAIVGVLLLTLLFMLWFGVIAFAWPWGARMYAP